MRPLRRLVSGSRPRAGGPRGHACGWEVVWPWPPGDRRGRARLPPLSPGRLPAWGGVRGPPTQSLCPSPQVRCF